VSGFQTKVFNSEDKNIFKFDDSKEAEMIEIKTAQNLETHVLNNTDIHIQKDQAIEIKGDAVYQVQTGSFTEKAKKIIYKVGGSTLTLKGSGAFLNAAKINLNCGGSAAEAKTEGLGAVGSGAAGNVNSAGNVVGSAAGKNSSSSDAQGDANNAEKTVEKALPSAEVRVVDLNMSLPPVAFLRGISTYVVTITNSITSDLKLQNKNRIDPVTFSKNGFSIEAKNETFKFFSDLKIRNPSSILSMSSNITLYNAYGNYTFALTAAPINPNEVQYIGTLNKNISIADGAWDITGNTEMNVIVHLSKNNSGDSFAKSLIYDLGRDFDKIKKALENALHNAILTPQQETALLAAVIVLAVILSPIGV